MPIYQVSVDIEWSGASGSPGVNVWHFRSIADSPVGDASLATFTTNLQNFYDDIKAFFPNEVSFHYRGEALSVVTGDADPEYVDAGDAWTVTGTSQSGFAPPATCMMLSLRTKSATRSGRGRKFLGPVEVGIIQDNGTVGESIRATVQQAINDFIGVYSSPVNGSLCVYSRTEKVARDVISATVPNKFGVLRSRRD